MEGADAGNEKALESVEAFAPFSGILASGAASSNRKYKTCIYPCLAK